MGEGMGFPGTDADTGASAARGCNALLMNTKNFIKDCLYIKLSTKLCPITPVAPFHAWKLLAAATVRHRLLHPPILCDSWIVLNSPRLRFDRDHSNSISRKPGRRPIDREMSRENEGSSIDFVSVESIISQPLKRISVYRWIDVKYCINKKDANAREKGINAKRKRK